MDYMQGPSRKEMLLIPEAIEDFISDENPVRFIEAFVDSLSLKELGFKPLPLNRQASLSPQGPPETVLIWLLEFHSFLSSIRTRNPPKPRSLVAHEEAPS